MKLKIDIHNLSFIKQIRDKLYILMWAFLGVVFLLVAWVAYGEISKVTRSQTDSDSIQKKIVRVNMDKYRALEKKLQDNATFIPEEIPGAEAFAPVAEVKPEKKR